MSHFGVLQTAAGSRMITSNHLGLRCQGSMWLSALCMRFLSLSRLLVGKTRSARTSVSASCSTVSEHDVLTSAAPKLVYCAAHVSHTSHIHVDCCCSMSVRKTWRSVCV